MEKSTIYFHFRWYCHFDDDEYVNVPVLIRTLCVHKDKVYLGHWPNRLSFHYANGPAYCISSTLMPKLEKFIRSGCCSFNHLVSPDATDLSFSTTHDSDPC